jgi:hypothetical protein
MSAALAACDAEAPPAHRESTRASSTCTCFAATVCGRSWLTATSKRADPREVPTAPISTSRWCALAQASASAGSSGVVEESSSGSESGTISGHPCCDVSGGACTDLSVMECACQHMPGCCSGAWGEACASVAVANGCLPEGCGTLAGFTEWSCTCSTYEVSCPDNPFVSQLIFGTDACGLTQADALAIVQAACEQGDGECSVGAGSCECECTDYGTTCGAAQ